MLRSKDLIVRNRNEVQYIQFPHLEATGLVDHGFSTRHGGVSEEYFASMNLSFTRGDDRQRVHENFRRFCDAVGVSTDSLVLSDQVHDTVIRHVTADDCGKGIIKTSDIVGVDGLITDEAGVTLTTFYADCVPLFFLDPKRKAIGLSHAGWRGSAAGIGPKTVRAMEKTFGSSASDILVGIAPSIGPCCYEVSGDVIMEFEKYTNRGIISKIAHRVDEDHWMLDLWQINQHLLTAAGVLEENIIVTDLCTKCHSDDLYSHRVMGMQRGSLAAMLALK